MSCYQNGCDERGVRQLLAEVQETGLIVDIRVCITHGETATKGHILINDELWAGPK